MPDLTFLVHHQILSAVRDVQGKARALRANSQPRTGYIGFDLAESTLAGLHEAITRSRDRDQIVAWLKKAVAHLKLTVDGEVSPAVEQAQQTFKALWERLEA
jgi:hypothetical protein